MNKPQYKIKGGKPTAKFKAGAAAGAVGGATATLATFLVALAFPQLPESVRGAVVVLVVALCTWASTYLPALLATYMRRPHPDDMPVVDKTTTGQRLTEPTPGID